jgi:predicted NAD/FAD-binding protein
MRIAIIGSGISGSTIAHHLYRHHDVFLFEKDDYVGGHVHTHNIALGQETYAIDTGFIVFNDKTYPSFCQLLNQLGVASQPSKMSFSVRSDQDKLEYNGTSLNGLFAQRKNLARPSFYRFIRDIFQFNRNALHLLQDEPEITLGDYLKQANYSQRLIDHYLLPMGAAIWSTDPALMLNFPARFFVRFLYQHGMLSIFNRPQWRVIRGGSAQYMERLSAGYRECIHLRTPIVAVQRAERGVLVKPKDQDFALFDYVFFACHADQALALLTDASAVEREILGAINYQSNNVVLHTDVTLLPKQRRAWAAWNYFVPKAKNEGVVLTYNMNILQNIHAKETFCVTLNHAQHIDNSRVIKRLSYRHPLYTPSSIEAQKRHQEINSLSRTYFCGAYWRYGFHEDGVVSALNALKHFQDKTHEKCDLPRHS